jgi:two-component system response regulator RegX3
MGAGGLQADLEDAGFGVVTATDSKSALAAAEQNDVDLAIVEGHFGGYDLAFCERLWAAHPGFPVLVVGPNDENLMTRALAAGADDYLVLPPRPAELVARVRAVLRRAPRRGETPRPREGAVRVGEVCLSPDSHVVTLNDARVQLPLREFELLRLLMENAGIVLSRATLFSRLWGPSAPVDGTSLEVHIRRLRAKLEDDPSNPKRIVTVRGIGYRYQVPR